MLCLSGFEIYSRWVPLKIPSSTFQAENRKQPLNHSQIYIYSSTGKLYNFTVINVLIYLEMYMIKCSV